ncbi:MAG: hypothetical protein KJO18_02370 [Acidimicrobiia bacterium]|nr:hypothetical protein [Acidimicrobiia bacterium]
MSSATALDQVRIVLRADANRAIGHGHVVRCKALATELIELGAQCQLVGRLPEGVDGLGIDEGLPSSEEPNATLDFAPDIVVMDLYAPDAAQIEAWRSASSMSVAIDDSHPHFEFAVDLLINPSLNPQTRHEPTPTTEYLAGPGFLLLRRGFEGTSVRQIRKSVESILVCFGGSDPFDFTPRVAQWLAGSVPNVILAVGSGYPDSGALEEREQQLGVAVVVGADIPTLMSEADVGVFAAGTLAYEAAAFGLPSILVSLNEPQRLDAEYLEDSGAAKHLTSSQLSAENLNECLTSLRSPIDREVMSRAGRSLVDGGGARRVADHIAALWHERGGRT